MGCSGKGVVVVRMHAWLCKCGWHILAGGGNWAGRAQFRCTIGGQWWVGMGRCGGCGGLHAVAHWGGG